MAQGDQSKFAIFVQAFAAQIQSLEDATYDTRMLRRFDVAADQQLDDIGSIVGEARQGKSDVNYKTAIIAKINMNASCGEPERLIAALKALVTDAVSVHYTEQYPSKVQLEFISDSDAASKYAYIQQVCSAGVLLIMLQEPTGDLFTLSSSSASETDVATGLSNTSQIDGGKLSQIIY